MSSFNFDGQPKELCELIDADFNEFEDIELLEILLASCVKWEQSHTVARMCQRRFGTILNMGLASNESLRQAGLPEGIILNIKVILTLSKRLCDQLVENRLVHEEIIANSNN